MEKRNYFIQAVQWASGVVSDTNGKFSRKAIALYVSLFLLYLIVKANVSDHLFKPDFNLLVAVVILILFCIGAISRETIKNSGFFNKIEKDKQEPE